MYIEAFSSKLNSAEPNLHGKNDTSDDQTDQGQDPDACSQLGAAAELLIRAETPFEFLGRRRRHFVSLCVFVSCAQAVDLKSRSRIAAAMPRKAGVPHKKLDLTAASVCELAALAAKIISHTT